MRWFTHLAFGILILLIINKYYSPVNITILILVLFASLFPDIDERRSKIGRKVKIIGWAFKHRGFFHSIFAILLFSLLIHGIFNNWIYTLSFLVSYLGHLVLDALTYQGISFFPFKRIKGFMKTGSWLEYILFLVLFIVIIIMFF